MKKILWVLFSLTAVVGCTKTFSIAKPQNLSAYQVTLPASPNDIYYALRWALTSNGYPIVEEDLQNGIITTHYVPVGAASHYADVFGHKDFGVTNAHHQLEVRLIPKSGKTAVQIHSRVQSLVQPFRSTGSEEKKILAKIGDYLRKNHVQITNLGVVKEL